jgi:hypothetical protein
MFIIIIALLLVAILKRQRKIEEEGRQAAAEDNTGQGSHFSTASRSVPCVQAVETTAQLARELLGQRGGRFEGSGVCMCNNRYRCLC